MAKDKDVKTETPQGGFRDHQCEADKPSDNQVAGEK